MELVGNLVQLYFSVGLSNKDILNLLAHQHHVIISIRRPLSVLMTQRENLSSHWVVIRLLSPNISTLIS